MKKIVSGVMLTLLLVGMLTLAFNIEPVRAGTIIVPDDYPTIQEAINNANDGDTIQVKAGTYYEKLVVNKTVSLVGESMDTTVLDGNKTEIVIDVTASNVAVSDFTIRGGGYRRTPFGWFIARGDGGICLSNVSGCRIFDNNLTETGSGAGLRGSWNNTISGNIGYIRLDESWNNTISENVGHIGLHESWNNTIADNTLEKAISMEGAVHNIIRNNEMTSLTLRDSHENIVTNNTLLAGVVLSGPWTEPGGCNKNVIEKNIVYGSDGIRIGDYSSNNSIEENTLTEGSIIIFYNWLDHPGNNTISNNTLLNGGIEIYNSENNTISGNICNNYTYGIRLTTGYNTLINNTLNNGIFGIYLQSSYNVLKENKVTDSQYNFGVRGFPNDIDASNTVDGKPVYYFVNQSNLVVDPSTYPNVGYLGFVNCYNVTARNLTLTGNGQGVFVAGGSEIFIVNNTITDNIVGVEVLGNSTSHITNNTIVRNVYGIYLRRVKVGDVCLNTIINNTISNNTWHNLPADLRRMPYLVPTLWNERYNNLPSGGILVISNNNTIVNNKVTNNRHGIYLAWSRNNTLRNNDIAGNQYNFGIEGYFSHYIHDVDSSNLVNGKPIFYGVNQHNRHVPTNAGYVALINSTSITVENLNLTNNAQGILLVGCNNTLIRNNTITNVKHGGITIKSLPEGYPPIAYYYSFNNTITNSTITNSGYGVYIWYSSNNTISRNILLKNQISIFNQAAYNLIAYNTIKNSTYPANLLDYVPDVCLAEAVPSGIVVEGPFNLLYGNTISNNDCGLRIGVYTMYMFNFVIHNNFINNTQQVYSEDSINFWDDDYPSGGNYWSDYNGTDLYSSSYQNVTGSDGIGDTPYIIDANNQDNYPLMKPYGPAKTVFNVSWNEEIYPVTVVTNSIVTDFNFSQPLKQISFNVTGPNGSTGFCNITIPKVLLRCESPEEWQIKIDDAPITDFTITENATHTNLYFTYTHTTHQIQIIGTKVIGEEERTLLGTGWGWMRIAPREYVYGRAELYKIGDTQIELVITYQGEEYSRAWNIILHREYKYSERYLCYSNEWGFLIVGLHKHRRWQFWYAVGKGVVAFGFIGDLPSGCGGSRGRRILLK